MNITVPTGSTVLQAQNDITAGGFTVTRILAWKQASGESGDYSLVMSGTSHNCQAVMLCVSGTANVTPVSSDNEGTGATTTALGVTTPSNNSLVAFIAHNWAGYGAASAPSGTTPTFTEQLDSGLMYVATGVLATAGATGNKTQANGNGASDGWAAYLVSCGP